MKKSFIEKLYFGDILPVERGFKRNARLYKKFKISQKEHEEMLAAIPKEYHGIIEKYVSTNISFCAESELAAFVYGVRYMLRFMLDAISDKLDDFSDDEDLG
ncbi:MAG: hypothetical protein IKZ47_04395 [Clostridia bacterium]|nr:hypothetical protein [Clostridia bacterium]